MKSQNSLEPHLKTFKTFCENGLLKFQMSLSNQKDLLPEFIARHFLLLPFRYLRLCRFLLRVWKSSTVINFKMWMLWNKCHKWSVTVAAVNHHTINSGRRGMLKVTSALMTSDGNQEVGLFCSRIYYPTHPCEYQLPQSNISPSPNGLEFSQNLFFPIKLGDSMKIGSLWGDCIVCSMLLHSPTVLFTVYVELFLMVIFICLQYLFYGPESCLWDGLLCKLDA